MKERFLQSGFDNMDGKQAGFVSISGCNLLAGHRHGEIVQSPLIATVCIEKTFENCIFRSFGMVSTGE